MAGNPFGASCGTSITTPPSKTRVTRNRLGTAGARLSDTAEGKAPKRARTREELESMRRHPAGRLTVRHAPPPQPPCTCKRCEEIASLPDELEALADMLLAQVHARIEQNRAFENGAYERTRVARAEHLKLMGDSDA